MGNCCSEEEKQESSNAANKNEPTTATTKTSSKSNQQQEQRRPSATANSPSASEQPPPPPLPLLANNQHHDVLSDDFSNPNASGPSPGLLQVPKLDYENHNNKSNINNTSRPSSTNNTQKSKSPGSSTLNYESPYVARHGLVTRETTAGDFHRSVLVESSPVSFHRLLTTFRVFIATWNVGDAEPASMAPLFAHINDHGRGADIIFVAVQECNYKPTDVKQQSARDHWNASIDAIFPDYAVVAHRGLWEMRTMLLVKHSIRESVTDIVVSREATGIASIAGNKGGIAVGCTAYETRLLFVGSHLAAHLEEVEKRNSDFYEIIEGIDREFNFDGIEPLNYFHHVFWCGDLNYRIDLSREEVLQAVKDKDIQKLLSKDQLINEMKKGNVFNGGFREAATPTFNPTYRYLRNTDPSEDRVYDDFKGRIPSWCDRILHKPLGGPNEVAHTVVYDCENDLRSSDHSPVFAIFDVNSRQKLRESLKSREDAWEKQQQKQTVSAEDKNKNNNSSSSFYTLYIADVSANGLLDADLGGDVNVSDPYIIFRIVGLSDDKVASSFAKTPVIQDNLNPVWKDGIFKIELKDSSSSSSGALYDVGMNYLHCIVMDEDVVKDDPLGQAVIPLDRVWELRNSYDEKQSAIRMDKVPVMLGGKQYGSISLSMRISKS